MTSGLSLLIYRFRSREIIACQVFDISWLGYIAYSVIFLGLLECSNW